MYLMPITTVEFKLNRFSTSALVVSDFFPSRPVDLILGIGTDQTARFVFKNKQVLSILHWD
jgi:hypothetical protein